MGKNWTIEDQMIFESDVIDSIAADVAYYDLEPSYNDYMEVDFNGFCDSIF